MQARSVLSWRVAGGRRGAALRKLGFVSVSKPSTPDTGREVVVTEYRGGGEEGIPWGVRQGSAVQSRTPPAMARMETATAR